MCGRALSSRKNDWASVEDNDCIGPVAGKPFGVKAKIIDKIGVQKETKGTTIAQHHRAIESIRFTMERVVLLDRNG